MIIFEQNTVWDETKEISDSILILICINDVINGQIPTSFLKVTPPLFMTFLHFVHFVANFSSKQPTQ